MGYTGDLHWCHLEEKVLIRDNGCFCWHAGSANWDAIGIGIVSPKYNSLKRSLFGVY